MRDDITNIFSKNERNAQRDVMTTFLWWVLKFDLDKSLWGKCTTYVIVHLISLTSHYMHNCTCINSLFCTSYSYCSWNHCFDNKVIFFFKPVKEKTEALKYGIDAKDLAQMFGGILSVERRKYTVTHLFPGLLWYMDVLLSCSFSGKLQLSL